MAEEKKQVLLHYIGKFVDDWRQLDVDNITVTAIGNGYVNSTHLVENVSQVKTLTRKLIVKSYGENVMGKALFVVNASSPLEQSLVACETARIGLGPRVFGCDEKGRVEEFIECEILTHAGAFVAEVAVAFAQFHSIQLPLSRDRCLGRERGDFCLMNQTYNDILQMAQRRGFRAKLIESLVSEVAWLENVAQSVGAVNRVVLVTGDPNYLNRLVVKKSAREHTSPIKLIDYDCTCYSWRGIELGGHFICQMFNFSDVNNIITLIPYPDESVQLSFLHTYLSEWKKLNAPSVDEKVDCLENLLKECYIGAMFMCLLWTWFRYCLKDDLLMCDEAFFDEEPKTFHRYRETKDFFKKRFCLA